MKASIVLLIAFFFLQNTNVFAQDPIANLNKYWHYRYRLVNYFMIVGDNQGNSLPAGVRNLYGDAAMHWGDTPRYMGWYLGVLATEYRLLKDNNQPTDRTLTELYYALRAIERLERTANMKWGLPSGPGTENGVLYRDDVPFTFADPNLTPNNYSQLNQNIPQGQLWTSGSGAPGEVNFVYSDFQSTPSPPSGPCGMMSQDHVYHLTMGLALIVKCLDNGALQFNNAYQPLPPVITADLKQQARDIMSRIVSYIRYNPNAQATEQDKHWRLYAPDGSVIGNVCGSDVFAFAQGFAHAAGYVTGNFEFDDWSEIVFSSFWQGQPFGCDNTNLHLSFALAGVCNCWVNFVNNNVTAQKIFNEVSGCNYDTFEWEQFYGALGAVLHDGGDFLDYIDLCKIVTMLNNAPFDGPFFHCQWDGTNCNNPDIAQDGWGASNRFMDPLGTQVNGNLNFRGNYNGLDYMLLFNLWYLVNELVNQQFPPFVVPNLNLSGIFPYESTTSSGEKICCGSITDPAHIQINPSVMFCNTAAGEGSVIFNNLILHNAQHSICFIPAELFIFSSRDGVLINEATVEHGSTLHIHNTTVSCFTRDGDYFFDPVFYQRINSMNYTENMLPPYETTEEFKQIVIPGISIFPNPNNGLFKIESENKIQNIQITDVLGNIIFQAEISSVQSLINLSSHPKGIYFIKVITGNGQSFVEKVVIQ